MIEVGSESRIAVVVGWHVANIDSAEEGCTMNEPFR